MIVQTALVFLFTEVHIANAFGPKVGPFDIDLQKFEHCDDEGSKKITYGTKITNAGKGKYIYKENFTFGVPLDNNIKVLFEAQRFGNGGWRPKAFEHVFNGCEAIWKVGSQFLKDLMNSAGVTLEKCPVPAGSYKADWTVVMDLSKMAPAMEYGKYRVFLRFHYKGEFIGCAIMYGEVKPKTFGTLEQPLWEKILMVE